MTLSLTPTAPETTGDLRDAFVPILYTNWRGETAVRYVRPRWRDGKVLRPMGTPPLWFGSTEWHPEPQWLLTAEDVDKGALRDFALSGIKAWGADAVEAARARGEDPNEATEWFWRIVDGFGLGNVPSDEIAALRLLCDRAAKFEATPTTPHPTGDVAALRALVLFTNDAGLRNVGDRVGADDEDLARVVTDADLLHELFRPTPSGTFAPECVERLRSALRTQLAGADTTAAPGSDGGVVRALPFDDDSRSYNDSALPSVMIWAGGDAIDELRADQSLDLDSCALAVGVYRAMTRAFVKESPALARRSTAATGQVGDLLRARLEIFRGLLFERHEGGDGYRLGDGGSLSLQITNAEARAILDTPTATPATGGAARLDREATEKLRDAILKAPQPLMHPNADWCEIYQRWHHRAFHEAYALALDPDPQPQVASEGVREAIARTYWNNENAIRLQMRWEEASISTDTESFLGTSVRDAYEFADMALAAITSAGRGADAGGWRAIETAPKEQQPILLALDRGRYGDISRAPVIGYWRERQGWTEWSDPDRPISANPTHWQPLPAAPTAPTAQGEA